MINNIRINFRQSIDAICKKTLLDAGFKLPKHGESNYLELLLNMSIRIIPPKKRNVHLHSTLKIPSNNTKGFFALIHKMQAGININSYQSHHLERIDFNDGFLNDFGLHHFHLGENPQGTGKHKRYITRTKNIAFAKVDENDIYILGIFGHKHGEKNLVFLDENLLQLIYDEWPHLLDKYIIKNATASKKYSPEERYNLRTKNLNAFITLNDGTTIISPGGGYMLNGTNANISLELLHLYRAIPYLKEQLFIHQELNYPYDIEFQVVTFGHNELSLFSDKHCFFTQIKRQGNNILTTSLSPGYGPIYAQGFIASNKKAIYNEVCKALIGFVGRDFLYPFPSKLINIYRDMQIVKRF
ncbi:hypothetical protein AAHY02_16860 [Klebsiella variicola subsp. variicola]|uniref:hypothetical protein n=1 Tax=Klebsiella variicola TaxID=244366 RepID=UPI00280BAC15|nr:hypothetical protein [Klebsiella variicola]